MSSESSTVSPEQQIMKMATGYWVSQVLSVAARTDMLEQLLDGPLSAQEVAIGANLQPGPTERVLRGCALVEVVKELEGGVFELTELGRLLTSGHPRSAREAAVMMGDPAHWLSWGQLEHTVRTGEPAFTKALGTDNVFAYYDANPDEGERFHRSMGSMTRAFISNLEKAYDFTPYATIADIGGGHGLLLGSVLKFAPTARGILFDQPHAVAGATEQLRALGVEERVTRVGGDFFQAVPGGADLYMMKHILHDWSDEQCKLILKNLRAVISASARLLVMDCVLPEPPAQNEAVLMDLNMLVMTPGRERRQSDFARLFASAGFRLERVVTMPGLAQLVEASPA